MKLVRTLFAVLAASLLGSALAGEAPQRKSGLWEMKTEMAGMPPQGAVRMCIDQASDNLMQERAMDKANCPVMDISRQGGKVIIHSVCKQGGMTVTSDAAITGDFDRQYRSEMNIRYSPPQQGMSGMKMTQEARWLGPCLADQKPGDVMMPGRPTMNMREMLKAPR